MQKQTQISNLQNRLVWMGVEAPQVETTERDQKLDEAFKLTSEDFEAARKSKQERLAQENDEKATTEKTMNDALETQMAEQVVTPEKLSDTLQNPEIIGKGQLAMRKMESGTAEQKELLLKTCFYKVENGKLVPIQNPQDLKAGEKIQFYVPDSGGKNNHLEMGVGLSVLPDSIQVAQIGSEKCFRSGKSFYRADGSYREVRTHYDEQITLLEATPEDKQTITKLRETGQRRDTSQKEMFETLEKIGGSEAEQEALAHVMTNEGAPDSVNPDDAGHGPSFGVFQFNRDGEMGAFCKYAFTREPGLANQFPTSFVEKVQDPKGKNFSSEDLKNLADLGSKTVNEQIEFKKEQLKGLVELAGKKLPKAQFEKLLANPKGLTVLLDIANQMGKGGLTDALEYAARKDSDPATEILAGAVKRLERLKVPEWIVASREKRNAGILRA